MAENPDIIVDGAHNPAGVRALAAYIRRFFADRKVWLIYATMRDKSVDEIGETLLPPRPRGDPHAGETCERALRPEAMREMFSHPKLRTAPRLEQALEDRPRRSQSGRCRFHYGSLYLVGEARGLLVKIEGAMPPVAPDLHHYAAVLRDLLRFVLASPGWSRAGLTAPATGSTDRAILVSHVAAHRRGTRLAEGLDRLPADGAFVYVSNHLSLADTPLMAGWLPTSFRFLAKESLMKVPIIGGHLRRGGHIAVERNDARAAVRSLARAEKLLRDARVSILVFAEGTRSQRGDLQAFKAGAAHLAIKSGAPVVPLAVHGTADVMPKGRKLLRPGVIRLLAGDPIPTAGLKAIDRDGFTERLQARVSELMDRVVQIPS